MIGICENCNEVLIGDGYKTVMRCPNATEDTDSLEPDANPVYCDLIGIPINLTYQLEGINIERVDMMHLIIHRRDGVVKCFRFSTNHLEILKRTLFRNVGNIATKKIFSMYLILIRDGDIITYSMKLKEDSSIEWQLIPSI